MAQGKKWIGETTICEYCGKVQPFPRPLKSGAFDYVRHRFCSNVCAKLAAHRDGMSYSNIRPATPPILVCPQCGKTTPRRYNKANQGYDYKQKFCSKACADAAQTRGSYLDKHGYKILTNGQPEHRAVMESMVGRKLGPLETVHHKNGIRHDNRPENLELWATRHGRGQRVADIDEDIWSGTIPPYLINCRL